jgi:transitional endoplasmic reticulum ATPase
MRAQILLHEGSKSASESLAMATGAYANALHEEILIFTGYWQKSHELWIDVQKADWGDVILDEAFKTTFRRDVESFFESEKVYKEYSIPWQVSRSRLRVFPKAMFIY